MFGRGVDGDITFAVSECLFWVDGSAANGVLEYVLTDRKFAAIVCVSLDQVRRPRRLEGCKGRRGPQSQGQREGETALKKRVDFVRLRRGSGQALGRLLEQGDRCRGDAGHSGGSIGLNVWD